jgi:hypothetical protein
LYIYHLQPAVVKTSLAGNGGGGATSVAAILAAVRDEFHHPVKVESARGAAEENRAERRKRPLAKVTGREAGGKAVAENQGSREDV